MRKITVIFLFVLISFMFSYGQWNIETIDTAGIWSNSQLYFGTSMQLDSNGYPHIAYCEITSNWDQAVLKYAKWNGQRFVLETITSTSTGNIGYYSSLALDNSDNPYISCYDRDDGNLVFYYKSGGIWTRDVVDSTGNVGRWTSLRLDSNCRPHISYTDETNTNIKYAYYDGSSWQIQTVGSFGGNSCGTSLVLDTNNHPHITYPATTIYIHLNYAYYDGSTWTIVTVDDTSTLMGMLPSIDLDSSGYPHISYLDCQNEYLREAHYNGIRFVKTTIATEDVSGNFSSNILDSNDNEFIAYQYSYMDSFPNVYYYLKLAYYDGSDWSIDTIDNSSEGAGFFNSIKLNSSNSPLISYETYNYGSASRLKIAYKDTLTPNIMNQSQKKTSFYIDSVFPNPAHETINCKIYSNTNNPVRLSLYDVSGRLVKSNTITIILNEPGSCSIDCTDLSSGIYILLADDGKNKDTMRVVISSRK